MLPWEVEPIFSQAGSLIVPYGRAIGIAAKEAIRVTQLGVRSRNWNRGVRPMIPSVTKE